MARRKAINYQTRSTNVKTHGESQWEASSVQLLQAWDIWGRPYKVVSYFIQGRTKGIGWPVRSKTRCVHFPAHVSSERQLPVYYPLYPPPPLSNLLSSPIHISILESPTCIASTTQPPLITHNHCLSTLYSLHTCSSNLTTYLNLPHLTLLMPTVLQPTVLIPTVLMPSLL